MPHIHKKIDFTVEVFLVHNNKVLLRKHEKYGIWLSVGGHIELDEDPNQAAIREVKEEVGLDIKLHSRNQLLNEGFYLELIPPEFMNRHKISDIHEHITLVYFAKSNTDVLNIPGGEEKAECKWFSLEELDLPEYNLKEHIKMYAKTALKELGK